MTHPYLPSHPRLTSIVSVVCGYAPLGLFSDSRGEGSGQLGRPRQLNSQKRCGDRHRESGGRLHDRQQKTRDSEEREEHCIGHAHRPQPVVGACDRYADHDGGSDEQQGRSGRGRGERCSIGRVGIQSRHSFHARQVSTSDAGLDERCAAKGSSQVNVRDSGEDQSRHGESGRATGDQIRGHSHDAEYRQGGTQNAGAQVADEENLGRDVARVRVKVGDGRLMGERAQPEQEPICG